jgi:hypothetical protein
MVQNHSVRYEMLLLLLQVITKRTNVDTLDTSSLCSEIPAVVVEV